MTPSCGRLDYLPPLGDAVNAPFVPMRPRHDRLQRHARTGLGWLPPAKFGCWSQRRVGYWGDCLYFWISRIAL